MQAVKQALSANAANKLAGKHLLQQLPWWEKLQARIRSYVLLLIIYATFWVSNCWASCMYSTVQLLTMPYTVSCGVCGISLAAHKHHWSH
jgi:hypothetical protein